jgi:hypothetical protein
MEASMAAHLVAETALEVRVNAQCGVLRDKNFASASRSASLISVLRTAASPKFHAALEI